MKLFMVSMIEFENLIGIFERTDRLVDIKEELYFYRQQGENTMHQKPKGKIKVR